MFSKTISRGPKNRIVQEEHPPNWGLTLLNCFCYRRNSASSLCKLLQIGMFVPTWKKTGYNCDL